MGELIFIGLGLYDEKDISVKGKEIAKDADEVYSEFYTSNLAGTDLDKIQDELGIDIKILDREQIEKDAIPVRSAQDRKTVILTAGDPMAATTHVDLRLRAVEKGVGTRVVHSSSIFSAAPSILGVQHYKFGKTVTLPFFEEKENYPESPYHRIKDNKKIGLHSLVLLDIDGKKKKYMSAEEGMKALRYLEKKISKGVINEDTVVAGLARVGSNEPELKAGYPQDILEHDFGEGLHCMVVFGDLHFMEIDSLIALADAPESIGEE
ncbi:MAG: diphthine synthase [Candidatus Saliniplasma sp.]